MSKKLTIEDFQVIAKKHGGKCLSDQYLNYNIKLRWECAKGHVWEASVDSIRQGHWCRKCGTEKSANKRRKSLEDMVLLAKRKNGKCLSEKYIDNATKLKWQCEKGHIWEATPGHIQNGRWCPYCKRIKLADRFRGDFQEYKDIAKSKGGSCLSVNYVNALTKLMWQCKEGHIWEAVPSAIKRGTWCPICGINRKADSLRASIEDAQRVAERHGGVCLSTQYIDAHKKLKWRCKEGHEWEASFGNVSSGTWCPFCAGSVKLTIEEMQKIARERGGLCLSSKYTNISTKLRWQCKEGHIWEAAPNSIKQGSWCPHCSGSMRLSLEQMQDLAKKKNGVCLSDKYINNRTKLKWQCENGHIWETAASSIIQGNWCPQCAGIVKKTIEDMHELAKQKNGRCLSEKYIDNKTKLIWQCERGHIWKAAPGHIQSGRWCPHCKPIMLADRFRGDFQEYKDIAKSKGGSCLSVNYVNARIKLRWQCKEGHIWEAVPSAIKRGTWCPKCSENISERICRKIFENIFNERFPKNRPDWLKLPNGRNMELDGYCSKLGIAFEYQGEQHYKDVLRYDGKRSLDQQKELDEFKRRKCEEHTVILIEVPFFVDYEKMPNFIIDECKKKNILVPKITKTLDYKLLNIYSPEKIKEMQEIAREKGGKCLSEKYINSVTKLKWQCEKGHTWEATPAAIKSGNWCHYCAGNLKWTLKQINDLAQEKKGVCLSEIYGRNYDKLRWRCEYGHVWEATVPSVRAGSWCPICGGTKKKTLLEMQNLAQLRQGKCISIQYINAHKKMTWQCKEGHTWQATPDDIQQGKWCPYCAHHIKLTIEQMKDLAKLKGGICLSTQYLGVDTKLRWKCKQGHIWEATPYHIKNRGTWCPKCSRKEAGMNRRLTIEEMQEIGIKKGGECLSKEYVNERALLQWRCKMNHIWQANAHDIKRGRWCPICKKTARKASIKYNRNYRNFPHQYTF